MSRYSARFKQSVVEDYLSGRGGGSAEVARRHRIDHSTVRKWVAASRVNLVLRTLSQLPFPGDRLRPARHGEGITRDDRTGQLARPCACSPTA
ncbi:transposase [Paraburkholderia phytofirmans]|uniref:transposase n=1 Tax=Paraburkholderia TaxID=1822464 RepID=UPI0009ECF509